MPDLDACRAQYEKDLAVQNYCSAAKVLTEAHRSANRRVFEQLMQYQLDIMEKGTLPFKGDSAARQKMYKDSIGGVSYPENMVIANHRELHQIMPIPDIHKVSDCDTIYRFLFGRNMNEKLALQDILYFIAFREKYALDTILWDREVETMVNGLDGEELLMEVLKQLNKKKTPKPPRPLLQPGWAGWVCGVDKRGHVVLYTRPVPRELARLEKRWPYVEGSYDHRNPEFFSVTAPYSNLLVRVYLRNVEKSRRLSRLLNYKDQHIIRNGLKVVPDAAEACSNALHDNGGGLTCLVDVGGVRATNFTSSKYKSAIRLFRLVSLMGQSYFPENMKQMIIINSGFIFKLIFRIIKPWLDPQTQKKMILISESSHTRVDDDINDSSAVPPVTEQDGKDEEDENAALDNEDASCDPQNHALRAALSEYIDDQFIPSWYGGKLMPLEAPVSYAGPPSKHITDDPHYPAALKAVKAKVLPEVLTDEFIMKHSKEGRPVEEAEWEAFCQESKPTLSR